MQQHTGASVNAVEALLLGIVQGLTEFLPISSTAHVTLMGYVLGLHPEQHAAEWTAFLASIQLGSLAAVLGYFRSELRAMVAALWQRGSMSAELLEARRLALGVVVGTLPIVLAGLALKPLIEGEATKRLELIAAALLGVTILMIAAERRRAPMQRGLSQLRWVDALLIGCAQILALMPGSSRSGSTIAVAMLLGIARHEAARFSFLLSIPAIAASGMLQLLELFSTAAIPPMGLLLSFLGAVVSSYAAIAFLLRYLRTHTLWGFIVYRLTLAAVLVGFALAQHG